VEVVLTEMVRVPLLLLKDQEEVMGFLELQAKE